MGFVTHNLSQILRSTVLLLALLLAACGMPGGLSAETAALAFLFDEQLSFSKDIDPFSIEFLHKQDFLGQVLLLGTFQVNDKAEGRSDCIMLFIAGQTANKSWSAIGHGSCAPYPAKEPRPRNEQAGTAFLVEPAGPHFYSYVYGRLWDETIRSLTVTWEDGLSQPAALKNNVYLAVREDKFPHLLLEGRDQDGTVVFSQPAEPGAAPSPIAEARIPTQAPTLPAADREPTEAQSTPSQEEQQAVASIRALRQFPDLILTFQGEDSSPNANMHPAMIFMDAQGGQYMVDRETYQVMEYISVSMPGMAQDLTLETLRTRAEQLALQQSPVFARSRSSLTYTESSKDGSSVAFRWEAPIKTGQKMPPFFQVFLRRDGEILNYINSLDVLED